MLQWTLTEASADGVLRERPVKVTGGLAFDAPGSWRIDAATIETDGNVVSVDGAAGCNVIGNVVGCEPDAVEIGQRVRAVYEEATDANGQKLLMPQWELAAE